MAIWTLLQVVLDLFFLAGLMAFWSRLKRPPQDDPRLSRGLQLLQTKITILEDLSNRTDNQAKQLTALFDQKMRMLQNKVLQAEEQLLKIDHSMTKSMEVAEIFQDKIPHHEILERQRTIEYVKTARLAHSGMAVDEIAERVSLPREQVELIAKFNREQLMFDEAQLPEWAKRATEMDEKDPDFALNRMDFVDGLEKPPADPAHASKIESEFKQAVEEAKKANIPPPPSLIETTITEVAQSLKDKIVSTAEDFLRPQMLQEPPQSQLQSKVKAEPAAKPAIPPQIKKVIFPRIEK